MFELFLQNPLLILLLFYGFTCISIVNEYERSVIFRLGRMVGIRGPGLIFVFRPFERQVKVSLRSIVLNVPSQDIITKDNVTLKVSAVVYYKVTNPVLAVTGVEDYDYATSQKAQTSLRSILGEVQLDQILSDREALVRRLREIVDLATEPWGVEVTSVELKSIDLPEQIQRAMGRQAEA
ncbi:MAG: SPFH domain-containing protein, partial [Holophagaceae bacterium]